MILNKKGKIFFKKEEEKNCKTFKKTTKKSPKRKVKVV